jgi:hypothetical protein
LNCGIHKALLKGKLEPNIGIPGIRMSKTQEIETLINEEALLLAMYLRNEKQTWIPRTISCNQPLIL